MARDLLRRAREILKHQDDSDDDISLTSTVEDLDFDENGQTKLLYTVECILAEAEFELDDADEEPVMKYLVHWEGYDIHKATWEPKESFEDGLDQIREAWREKRMRQHRELEPVFDIDRWLAENDIIAKADEVLKEKRRRRRERLGLGVTTNQCEDGTTQDPVDTTSSVSQPLGTAALETQDQSLNTSSPPKGGHYSARKSQEAFRPIPDKSTDVRQGTKKNLGRAVPIRHGSASSAPLPSSGQEPPLSVANKNAREKQTNDPLPDKLSSRIRAPNNDRNLLRPSQGPIGSRASTDNPRKSAVSIMSTFSSIKPAKKKSTEISPITDRSAMFPTLQARNKAHKASRREVEPRWEDVQHLRTDLPANHVTEPDRTVEPATPNPIIDYNVTNLDQGSDSRQPQSATGLSGNTRTRARADSPLFVVDEQTKQLSELTSSPTSMSPRQRSSENSSRIRRDTIPSSTTNSESRIICWYFASNETCLAGTECALEHGDGYKVAPPHNTLDKKDLTCQFWLRDACKFDNSHQRCPFAHSVTRYTQNSRLSHFPQLTENLYPRESGVKRCAGIRAPRAQPQRTRKQAPSDAALGCYYFWLEPNGCGKSNARCKFAHDQHGPIHWVASRSSYVQPIYIGPPDLDEDEQAWEGHNGFSNARRHSQDRHEHDSNGVSGPCALASTNTRVEAPITQEKATAAVTTYDSIELDLCFQAADNSTAKTQIASKLSGVTTKLRTYLDEVLRLTPTLLFTQMWLGRDASFYFDHKSLPRYGMCDVVAQNEVADTLLHSVAESLACLSSGAVAYTTASTLIVHPVRHETWSEFDDFPVENKNARLRLHVFGPTRIPESMSISDAARKVETQQDQPDNVDGGDLINVVDLLRRNSDPDTKVDPNIFLMFPDQDDSLVAKLIHCFHQSNLVVFKNKPGSWKYFRHNVRSGVVLFPEQFAAFDIVPELSTALKEAVDFNFFRLQKSLTNDTYYGQRLFPSGRILCIMDECFSESAHDVLPCLEIQARRINHWPELFGKILIRQDGIEWVKQLSIERAKKYAESGGDLRQADCILYDTHQLLESLINRFKDTHREAETDDMAETLPVISGDPNFFVRNTSEEQLKWFSFYASMHAHESRRCVVLTTQGSFVRGEWAKQYGHLEFTHPEAYPGDEELRRKHDSEKYRANHSTKAKLPRKLSPNDPK